MADTKFKPGFSGNSAGRPRRKTVRELVGEKSFGEVIDALVIAAKAGDAQAAKLLLPPMKPELPRAVIPALETAKTHTEKAEAITTAAARGEISPDVAAQLSAVVANGTKVAEFDALVREVAEIKSLLTAKGML